ncbi:helix-turn-helix transcriptional regulator [Caenimonas soli]|uniref:helix-turn-helix transcriptional regulator n=1 Tax=Caenimonas soli TaxID=2735555 RepID=UPI001554AE30|nr:AraC family transcriptional regulator [Caenimonas soli]NPC58448.1 helix-turn-helix transcriptional regulator [Caenimonas soli]
MLSNLRAQNSMPSRRSASFVEPGMFELHCQSSPPTAYPEETHDSIQVCIPLQGAQYQVTRQSETGRKIVQKFGDKDILLVSREQQHAVHWLKSADIVSLQLSNDFITQALGGKELRFEDTLSIRNPFITSSAALLKASLASGEDLPCPVAAAFATLLAYGVSQSALTPAKELRSKHVTPLSGAELRKLDRHIDEHIDQAISLADLANCVGMSLWHFTRRFEAAQGITPHAYVTNRRLVRAKSLLSTTHRPVIDVALEVGMNHSHFTRTFGKAFGVTPREFRHRVKGS